MYLPNGTSECEESDQKGGRYLCGGYIRLQAQVEELKSALKQALSLIDRTANIGGGDFPAFRAEYDTLCAKVEPK
jgi:hypothetical protein